MKRRHRNLRFESLSSRICPAIYLVDTAADVVDSMDGRTSLREAVEASNLSVDEDEIQFADDLSGSTFWLTGGELRVLGSLVIVGPGADRLTIDATGSDPTPLLKNGDGTRVFNIINPRFDPSITFKLRGLTLAGGDVGDRSTPDPPDHEGGCIFTESETWIEDSVIKECYAVSAGGAVYADFSNLEFRNVVFANNRSSNEGGAVATAGGSNLRVFDSWFVNNASSLNGGGLLARVRNVSIENSTFSGNRTMGVAGADGGAIALRVNVGEIVNSTIAENSILGLGEGGAIHPRAGKLTIRHSTIARNTTGGRGLVSGVHVEDRGELVLDHSIVAGNFAPDRQVVADVLTVRNSLISSNQGSGLTPTGSTPDADGNLIGSEDSPIDAGLGELSQHGGRTPTISLSPESPAIDAGSVDFSSPPLTDQRGAPRVLLERVDIGAFEFAGPGDINDDGILDSTDIDQLCAAVTQSDDDQRWDLNQDGVVNSLDVDVLTRDILRTGPGGSNLDGLFDSRDLVMIFAQGEYEDAVAGNSGWADGDWNCDAEFSSKDLIVAFQEGAYSAGARWPDELLHRRLQAGRSDLASAVAWSWALPPTQAGRSSVNRDRILASSGTAALEHK
jgi:hypothetical protein